jgi:MFS family permease
MYRTYTVGVYGSGPLLGNMVDKRGPRPLLIWAFFALFIGYFGIRVIYNQGVEDSISTFRFIILVLLGLSTGTGSNAGLIAAVNTGAKSFPDSAVRAVPLNEMQLC